MQLLSWQFSSLKLFFLVALLQGIAVLACQSVVFVEWKAYLRPTTASRVPTARTVPTNLGLFAFSVVFQLLYIGDAIRLRSTIQISAACVFNLGLLFHAVFQRDQVEGAAAAMSDAGYLYDKSVTVWSRVGPLLLAIPIVVAVFSVVLAGVAWRAMRSLSWSTYREVGADVKMRKRHVSFQLYAVLLKVDCYAIICFLAVYCSSVLSSPSVNFILSIVGGVFALAILFLSLLFSRRENRIGMIFVLCTYFLALAYFVYMLIIMHLHNSAAAAYAVSLSVLSCFALIAILTITMTIATSIVCLCNFGKGLKDYIDRHEHAGSRVHILELQETAGAGKAGEFGELRKKRMSLD